MGQGTPNMLLQGASKLGRMALVMRIPQLDFVL